MFPEGAFNDHAKKQTIFAAIQDGYLLGYVLFRITQSKQTIYITHLCIHPNHRKKGVAKFLLDAVKEKYFHLYKGISLSCRKDYLEASAFWETYGFKAVKTTRSRSKNENYLIRWWYDFGNIDLFSNNIDASLKVNALLDSNIIMKLSDENCEVNTEALALAADWLTEETEYFYAPEVFNEVNRDLNFKRAEATRQFIHTLCEARFIPDDRDKILQVLDEMFVGTSVNDRSDRKQLAECIASGIEYFITLDTELLNASDKIYERFSMKVLRPADFILFIDHSIKGRDYHSYRVAGARYEHSNIKHDELEKLVEPCWLDNENGEKKHSLLQKLTATIGDIRNSVFRLIKDASGDCIAYFAVNKCNNELFVKAIRVKKGKISDILFQQLVKDIILLSIERECAIIKVEETYLSNEKLSILRSFGFEYSEQGLYKVIVIGQCESIQTLTTNNVVRQFWNCDPILAKINELSGTEKNVFKLQIEKRLWPVRFTDIEVPTYVVPIKPYWAGQLFDHFIAGNNLFGAKPELSWSKENVYYRSVKPVSEIAPGRILWYVSMNDKDGVGRDRSIVATSYLEEVHVGPAKILFQKFKNYGIYEWRHIYQLANQEPLKEIKALKFTDTEVFKKVISLQTINNIMKVHGRPTNTFASPVEVSAQIFNEIYRLGKG
nr:GNAT family N-acetyltransferase [Longitalea luteola]